MTRIDRASVSIGFLIHLQSFNSHLLLGFFKILYKSMDEDRHSKEFYWTNVFFQVGGYFGRQYIFSVSCPYRITALARSRTCSSRYLDANSNNRLKSSQICSAYPLGLLRVSKVKLKNILSYLKDTRRTTLLACWKWCTQRTFLFWCRSCIVTSCLLRWGVYRARSLISGSKIDLVLTKEEWVSVLKLSTIWNMNKVGWKYVFSNIEVTNAWY